MTDSSNADGQRIAKLLARAGVASRRDVERMIAEGRVALDGVTLDTPATILPSLRGVTVDGQPVQEPEAARLFRYHKPPGLLTAARDPAGRATIYDRLPRDLPRVMPVGRLDLNTEGLLLLTTDGELKREMELPSTGVPRTYRARAFGEISQDQLESLIEGVEIEGVRYGSIDANLERRTGRNQWIEMTLTEGKNREVRRVLEHLGLQVSRLIRTAYGPFHLADLAPGEVDEVRRRDVTVFRNHPTSPGAAPRPRPAAPRPRPVREENGRPKPARPSPTGSERVARAPRPLGRAGASETGKPAERSPAPARRAPTGPSPFAGSSRRPFPARAEDGRGLTSQGEGGRPQVGRTRGRAAPAPHKNSRDERRELHHRPEAKPSRAPAEGPEKPARPKRGAGWAKAKPKSTRPSSRPTRRGEGAKRGPSKDRPGGTKK